MIWGERRRSPFFCLAPRVILAGRVTRLRLAKSTRFEAGRHRKCIVFNNSDGDPRAFRLLNNSALMKPFQACQVTVLVLMMGLALACGKATGVPDDGRQSVDDSQKVPFELESQPAAHLTTGLPQPSGSLPEGTAITIRLLKTFSSAQVHGGDHFEGTLEDPISIAGRNVIPRGAAVTGRILAAKASGRKHDPGYLRIALTSLSVDGKSMPIETSSLFVKGGTRDRTSSIPSGGNAFASETQEVSFDAERRLTFRLAQALELQ